jgi:hypothetical protein
MNKTVANPSIVADTQLPAQGRASTMTRLFLSNEFGLAVLLVLTFLIFANTLQGYSSTFSLFTIGRQIGINTMIGLAMMAVIVTGGLDLSVGAIGACTAMFFGYLAQGVTAGSCHPACHCIWCWFGIHQWVHRCQIRCAQFYHYACQHEHFLRLDDISDQSPILQSASP